MTEQRMRNLGWLGICLVVLGFGRGEGYAQALFEERAGLVVMEAESAALDGAWYVATENVGYTGSGYVVADEVVGTLSYPITITTTGRYLVSLRSAAPHPTEHNDTWVRLEGESEVVFYADNGPACSQFEDGWYKTFMNESDSLWSWNNKNCDHTERRVYAEVATPGTYTLHLRARSTEHMIDRIVLRHASRTDGDAQHIGLAETRVQPAPQITGTLQTWHRMTLTFEGPEADEMGDVNPFLDYRMHVTFQQGGRRYTVSGFFAADGHAAETSATTGNKWRVHFAPDSPGLWTYTASFHTGGHIALSDDPYAGTATAFDGYEGQIRVKPTDKTGRDFRAKGMLRYTGERYLRHAGTYEPFIKGGPGSPENLLGYHDFDGTYDNGGAGTPTLEKGLHRYEPHIPDWNTGDPSWQNGKGKGLIGGLNYIAGKGMNTLYFLSMNWAGDGNDVWPWTEHDQQDRFDVSKLDQWEIVFSHMDSLGIAMNMLLQETENDTLFDGGTLGTLRKLYFRELVARFGHHLALTWNVGEENNNTTEQRLAFANYLRALDPYDHPVVVHNHVHLIPQTYDPLLGHPAFTGTSFQIANPGDTHLRVLQYLDASAATGHPWVVNLDEIGHYSTGLSPDGSGNNHAELRRDVLWATLMAGGGGVEWYFGYTYPHADLVLEDWRSRDAAWDMTRHALQFFWDHLPFDEMQHHDGLTWPNNDYVLAKLGEVYAIYRREGGGVELELKDYPDATFSVQWYNPVRGGPLVTGERAFVQGGSHIVDLGEPPHAPEQDWVVLVQRVR